MAETLVEETIAQENIYGITPEMRKEYRQKLELMIQEQGVKIARTTEELYAHSIKDDDGEEIDEFLRMREEWRNVDDSHREIDTLNRIPPKKSFKVMANFKIGGRRKPLKYDFSDIDFEVDV